MPTPNPVATERQLQAALKEAAERLGYLAYHCWTSLHSPAGFPDLFLAHPRTGFCIALECKGHRGKVTAAQRAWILALGACGIPAFVVYPADEDAIIAILIEGASDESTDDRRPSTAGTRVDSSTGSRRPSTVDRRLVKEGDRVA